MSNWREIVLVMHLVKQNDIPRLSVRCDVQQCQLALVTATTNWLFATQPTTEPTISTTATPTTTRTPTTTATLRTTVCRAPQLNDGEFIADRLGAKGPWTNIVENLIIKCKPGYISLTATGMIGCIKGDWVIHLDIGCLLAPTTTTTTTSTTTAPPTTPANTKFDLTASEGEIRSPRYPADYPPDIWREWRITVPSGKARVGSLDFDLEDSPTCEADYLEVFDGHTTSDPSLGSFCGVTSLQVLGSGRRLMVRFFSDEMESGRGFKLRYSSVDGCGTTELNTATGTITSPGFPVYPNYAKCKWIITASQGVIIEIISLEFHLEDTLDCDADNLVVNDGHGKDSPILLKACGNHSIHATSSSNKMMVHFRSDGGLVERGFELVYRTKKKNNMRYIELAGDCLGNALGQTERHSQAECEVRCTARSGCLGYSYNNLKGLCILKYRSCSSPVVGRPYIFFEKPKSYTTITTTTQPPTPTADVLECLQCFGPRAVCGGAETSSSCNFTTPKCMYFEDFNSGVIIQGCTSDCNEVKTTVSNRISTATSCCDTDKCNTGHTEMPAECPIIGWNTANINNVNYPTGRSPGGTAVFTCKAGFELKGKKFEICTATRSWTQSTMKTCEPIKPSCQKFLVSNGNVIYSSTEQVTGTTSKTSCRTGFNLKGEAILECRSQGVTAYWSGNPAKCEPVPLSSSSRYTDLGGNCRGNEIGAMTKKTKEACQAQCDGLSNCAGFSYSEETSYCLLKSNVCGIPVMGLSFTFYKKETGSSFSSAYTKLNGNCSGNLLTDKMAIDQAGCEKQCDKNNQCVGYSFIIGRDQCILKKASCWVPDVESIYTFFKKNTRVS